MAHVSKEGVNKCQRERLFPTSRNSNRKFGVYNYNVLGNITPLKQLSSHSANTGAQQCDKLLLQLKGTVFKVLASYK